MGLKQAIIVGMKVKQLRKAVEQLDVTVESYREKRSLASGLSKSRRATAEALVEFLSEKDVKRLCDLRGVESKGRRRVLIERLLGSADASSVGGSSIAESKRPAPSRKKGRRRRVRGPAKTAAPDLQFGFSTDRAGFTPAGIAAFSDLRPAAVVRELIQNSLDAALIEAREPCAHVRFERSACSLVSRRTLSAAIRG